MISLKISQSLSADTVIYLRKYFTNAKNRTAFNYRRVQFSFNLRSNTFIFVQAKLKMK